MFEHIEADNRVEPFFQPVECLAVVQIDMGDFEVRLTCGKVGEKVQIVGVDIRRQIALAGDQELRDVADPCADLARLLSVTEPEITLANSSSYGLHLFANGLGLGAGDNVIVAANDFPSDILPWLRLGEDGVTVTKLVPARQVLSADEIRRALIPQTRVVCIAWVHSFRGNVTDLESIGGVCRDADVLLVVNASQGVGAMPIAPGSLPIDAMTSVGFKWLCGPYGTGFCWLGSRMLKRLRPQKLYWLNALTVDDLALPDLDLNDIAPSETGRHDIFGTANFFNFAALTEAIRLVDETGVDRIWAHNLELASQLVDGIDAARYEVQDRGDRAMRSSIVFLRPIDHTIGDVAEHIEAERVDVALRRGMIRVAPHFYNSTTDIDRAVAALNG